MPGISISRRLEERNVPIVTVHWFSERTHEMRAEVADGIADVISRATKAPKDIVRVLFIDVPTTHWSKGGELVSDYTQPPSYLKK
jgi:4-oxalocrotonate tautomerase family enzyme